MQKMGVYAYKEYKVSSIEHFHNWGPGHWVIRSGRMFLTHKGKWIPPTMLMSVGKFVDLVSWPTQEAAQAFVDKHK